MAVEKCPWPISTGSRLRISELWKGFDPGCRRLLLFDSPSETELEALDSYASGEYTVVPPDRQSDRLLHIESAAGDWQADVVWASDSWIADSWPSGLDCPLIVDVPSIMTRLIRAELFAHASLASVDGEVKRMVVKALSAPARLTQERKAWSMAQLITPCSHHEQAMLSRRLRRKSVVIPNGASVLPFRSASPGLARLLFVGSLHYPPNAEAAALLAERVLPEVRQRHPGVVVDIVGAGPKAVLQHLNRREGVLVHGFVDDLYPFYLRASHVVAPLRRHAGTNIKILEAIAHSVPVVTTRVGLEGFHQLSPGRDVAVAPTWKSCSSVLSDLLDDPGAGVSMAKSAWEKVNTDMNWDVGRQLLREALMCLA